LVDDDRIVATVDTQANGSFECRGLASDRVVLHVLAKDMKNTSVDLGAMKHGEIRNGVEIRLEPRPPITGQVQWPNGNPAARCVVRYSPELDSDMGFSDEPVTCDALGGFRIVAPIDGKPMSLTALWPTDLEVPAVASEAVFSWVAHRDDVEQGTSGLILTLVPSSNLQVKVLDESGVRRTRDQQRVRPSLLPRSRLSKPPIQGEGHPRRRLWRVPDQGASRGTLAAGRQGP
jgi:hypothetical protein